MAGPLAVRLHHRRDVHRRDASPTVARLHLNLLVERSLDGYGGTAAAVAMQPGVSIAQFAEHVGDRRRMAVA